MIVRDIVSFSKDNFYNGAVQTEWFYDSGKRNAIAESYVFHGPKYYGVSQADVRTEKHKLIDTASFAQKLTDKLYSDKPDNCFVMNIAGYGTGKSHLAVCLGTLFSDNTLVSQTIATNISEADSEIGEYIKKRNDGRNLVVVLNGMNNFNLDAEMLRCVRLSLRQSGVSDTYLQKLTKAYDIARHFVDNMYDFCQDRFLGVAQKHGITVTAQALKKYLLSRVDSDSRVLQTINDVYEQVNGDKIAWDRGLSAGDILVATQNELCGPGKPFNKILILFDEFGRYIEYTAANPAIAGEATLQQIFEAVQTANGKIIFVGFIQNELRAYLSRIDNTGNVFRYIGRYDTACDHLHLSSNFETILANILKKKEPAFSQTVGTAVGKYERFHSKMQLALNRWDRSVNKKGVWTSPELYKTVILKGCYPLHPITVWLLSGSHTWMQQRSTLAFSADMFDDISATEIDGTWLPYIYPAQIIDSGIFSEMVSAEEKGLVASQYCMLYRDIITKIGDKLSDLEKTVLKAILVVNMGHMAFLDRTDALTAIQYCSGLSEDHINHAIKSLEDNHGVIAFDESAKTFDFLAEASGFNEFQRLYVRHSMGQTAKIDDLDQEIREQLRLTGVFETSFGQENHISSTEWCFAQRLHDSTDITEMYLQNVVREISANTDGDKPRGMLIYAYCAHGSERECNRIAALYKKLELNKVPVIILLVDDPDGEILTGIKVRKTLRRFSEKDQTRFKKHIDDQNRRQSRKIITKFNQSVTKREMITTTGRTAYTGRINSLCSQCFANLFTSPVPFVFDGFENKGKTQARPMLTTLCINLFNNALTNVQVYGSLTKPEKNRIATVLSTREAYSWKVYTDNCQLIAPQNNLVSQIEKDITAQLEHGDRIQLSALFKKYYNAPYGMNDNSVALFVFYYLAYHGNKYFCFLGNDRLRTEDWIDPKKKTYKLPDLKRISIQKNAHANIDAVAELCAKILSNTQIEQCGQLKVSLNNLIDQEGESAGNRHKIAEAKAYLEVGFRMVRATREKLDKVRTAIDTNTKNFDIVNAVRILEMLPVITPLVEEGYLYEYSDTYKNDVADLTKKLTNLMDRHFTTSVSKLSCRITELSQFKSTYTKTVKILRDHEFTTYAATLETRINSVEKDLLAKQRYEQVLAEVEKDLMLSSSTTKYQDCCNMIATLTKWNNYFIKINDLPADFLKSILNRIASAVVALEKRKTSLQEEVAALTKSVTCASTLVSLKETSQKLDRLSQMGLDDEQIRTVIAIQEAINKAVEDIEHLPADLDSLIKYISTITARTNSYCWAAIKECAMSKKLILEKKQSDWIKEFLIPAEQNLSKMGQFECVRWLEKAKSVPSYVDSATRKRLEDAKLLVEGRLHSSRVEQLLAMYDGLSDGEKQTFRKMLIGR